MHHGYCLTDLREHIFCKDGTSYAFADIEGLTDFAGAPLLLLSLEQYLRLYQSFRPGRLSDLYP